jgi:hypothetical protein
MARDPARGRVYDANIARFKGFSRRLTLPYGSNNRFDFAQCRLAIPGGQGLDAAMFADDKQSDYRF